MEHNLEKIHTYDPKEGDECADDIGQVSMVGFVKLIC